ncbi:MAG: ribbon-helix-helix domain-containing protein [Allorhizobium sp.]
MTISSKRSITVSLDPADIDRIEAAVASGDFQSLSQVVEAALSLWAVAETEADFDRRLKSAYYDGKASGPPRELQLPSLLRELKLLG